MEVRIRAGQTFLKYQLRREIGRGGMGVVFEAWDDVLHRPVALKVLYERLLSSQGDFTRIHSEARAAAMLCHPNIVRVHTLVEHDGITAIEMEYVDGRSLSDVLKGGALGVSRSIHVLMQVLSALEACHKKGMAHLDLKPSNILLTPEGHVYLTDFGLARAIGRTQSTGDETEKVLWSTPRYAPPELWRGARPAMTWDVYSAAVVACECLTGIHRAAETKGEDASHAAHAALRERVSNISPELARLLDRMLAKNPKNRPVDAADALKEFRRTPEFAKTQGKLSEIQLFRGDATIPGLETVTVEVQSQRRFDRRHMFAAAAIAVLLFIVAAGFYRWQHAATGPTEQPVSQIHAPPVATAGKLAPYSSDPRELKKVGTYIYFTADDGVHGRELWCLGDENGLRRVPGEVNGIPTSSPRGLFAVSDGVYFCAETPETGPELFKCAAPGGDELVVSLVRDIMPGPMGSDPKCVASLWPSMLFYATTRNEGTELWSTLGSSAQTAIVSDLMPGPQGIMPESPMVIDGGENVFVLAFADAANGLGLCRYRFSDNKVLLMSDVSEDVEVGAASGGRAYFAQTDAEHGKELWSIDAASGETRILLDIAPGPDSSSPSYFAAFGDQVLFRAATPGEGVELWISDGSTDGTRLLRDIRPGPEGSDPWNFKTANGRAFFKANDGAHGVELWVTDGTADGTRLVSDVWPGTGDSVPYNIVPGERFVAFSANDGVHGEELWFAEPEASGWHAFLVKDFLPGSAGAEPYELIWTTETSGIFVATAPGIGRELISFSGEPARVFIPVNIWPEPGMSREPEERK